jgi:hypothetical protein
VTDYGPIAVEQYPVLGPSFRIPAIRIPALAAAVIRAADEVSRGRGHPRRG